METVFQAPELQLVHEFAIALLIGALVGIEREKHKTLKQHSFKTPINHFV